MHIAQVPPPPQADGKNIFCSDKAVNKLDPGATATSVSPLINNFTSPAAINFCLAYKSAAVAPIITTKNAATAKRTVLIMSFF